MARDVIEWNPWVTAVQCVSANVTKSVSCTKIHLLPAADCRLLTVVQMPQCRLTLNTMPTIFHPVAIICSAQKTSTHKREAKSEASRAAGQLLYPHQLLPLSSNSAEMLLRIPRSQRIISCHINMVDFSLLLPNLAAFFSQTKRCMQNLIALLKSACTVL